MWSWCREEIEGSTRDRNGLPLKRMRPFWHTAGGFAAALLLVFSRGAAAAEYSVEPSMSLYGNYDSNPELGTVQQSVVGTTLSPAARLNALTERLELHGKVMINLTEYFNRPNLDAAEQYYTLSSRYPTERGAWELQSGYTRDLTLTTELAQTGQVLVRTPRNLVTIDPKWSRSLTETVTLELEYVFSDAHYSDPSLVSYQTHQGTTRLIYAFTERDSVSLNSYYLAYNAPATNFSSNEYGVTAGLEHPFTETFKWDLTAGFRNTLSTAQSPSGERSSRNIEWVAEADLEKRSETLVLRGGFSREALPSGGGYLVDVNHLSFFVQKTLTQTVSASLSLDGYLTQAIGVNLSVPDSHYYRIEQHWDWQWAERWSMGATYRYARQEQVGTSTKADSNAVFLVMTYRGPKWAISR